MENHGPIARSDMDGNLRGFGNQEVTEMKDLSNKGTIMRMLRNFRTLFILLALLAIPAISVAQVSVGVAVSFGPPELPPRPVTHGCHIQIRSLWLYKLSQ
jgi:hypothetical protein